MHLRVDVVPGETQILRLDVIADISHWEQTFEEIAIIEQQEAEKYQPQIFLVKFSKLISVDLVLINFESPNPHIHIVCDRILNALCLSAEIFNHISLLCSSGIL